MTTSITKRFNFEAAHQLPNHKGKCARLHGHSYLFEVTISGSIVTSGSSEGMVMDFAHLADIVEKEIIEKWDHQFLNDMVSFSTTAELLAAEIFRRIKLAGLPVTKVQLWETKKASAIVKE
ncbi:MAG TPA: 6-carboxytetrahydropterin synthase QueD [Candidatus Paceibacterota bacterium]